MKRFFAIILTCAMALSLCACSSQTLSPPSGSEGVAPYALSEGETALLQAFGMEGTSQILSFHAPKEAISLGVSVYELNTHGSWEDTGGGGIFLGSDAARTQQLAGTFTMQLEEDYVIAFNITNSGRASYETEKITLDAGIMASTTAFLTQFQEIELNQEIPVALMVYDSGTAMRSYTLQDYFEPSVLEGMDLVQVVTLTFSDKEL